VGVLRTRAVDGRAHFGYSLEEYARRGLLFKIARRAGVRLPPTSEVAKVEPLPAILHRDSWIVQCPDCPTAAYVWVDQPLMMCAYCFNVKAGGLWRPVTLPKNREAIEELLSHRAFAYQRNWVGESIPDLRRENIKNGDPIPAGGR
jgi:hypothetical protein